MQKFSCFVTGCLVGIMLCSSVALATPVVAESAVFNYFFHGVEKTPPADQQGLVVNGRAYVPLRFVAESLNLPVDYDAATKSIYVGARIVDLVNIQPVTIRNVEKKSVSIAGTSYANILWLRDTAWAKWDLGQKYTKLTLVTGYDSELIGAERGGKLTIMADGKVIGDTENLTAQDGIQEYTFDMTGVKQVEIQSGDAWSNSLILKAVVE
jgi:hypothetical protein